MSSTSKYFGIALAAAIGLGVVAYQVFGAPSTEDKKKVKGDRSSNPINDLPVIDFSLFFNKDADPVRYEAECQKVAYSLHHYGLVVLKDPRVSESDNDIFLSMMERYFEISDGVRDSRPNLSYQIGVTGEKIEKARDHCKTINNLTGDDKPLSPCPPIYDHKWRFFWRIGPIPEKTEFPIQNTEVVIPPEFPEWKDVMNMWGQKMSDATFTLAEMAAVGFGMPADSFTKRMQYGPHLLAPTGSDFNKYGQLGTVLAGFHYDLNFLTIHGKSRFPGLDVWTREGKRVSVTVPDGCLLVQVQK